MEHAMVYVRNQLMGNEGGVKLDEDCKPALDEDEDCKQSAYPTDLGERVLTEAKETEELPYAIITKVGSEMRSDFDGDVEVAAHIAIDMRADSVKKLDILNSQVMCALRQVDRNASNRLLSGTRVSEDETDEPARGDTYTEKVVSRVIIVRILTY